MNQARLALAKEIDIVRILRSLRYIDKMLDGIVTKNDDSQDFKRKATIMPNRPIRRIRINQVLSDI